MTMTQCTACGTTIQDKKNRVSLTDKVCMSMLSEVAAGTGGGGSIDPSGYVCKKCKGKLHKLNTLKKQARELQESIMASLPTRSMSPETDTRIETQQAPGTSIQGTPTGRKRALEEPGSKSRKRQRLYLKQIELHPTQANSSTPECCSMYHLYKCSYDGNILCIIVHCRLPSFTRASLNLTS